MSNKALILLFSFTALFVTCSITVGSINSDGARRVIKVATYGHDNPTCLSNASRPCKSVNYALSSKELNDTLVSIENGFYPLNRTISIEYVKGLSITGAGGSNKTVIFCNKNGTSGFVFRNCENISLVNLELQLCGSKFKSSSRVENTPVFSYAALLMENSKNVQWTDVRVYNSSGIGSVFYDVSGMITMTGVKFKNNIGSMEQLSNITRNSGKIYNAGGGIYIEFRPIKSTETSTYLLRNCNFSGNIADDRKNDVISDSIGQSYFSLGRGGGISFISRGHRSGNQLTLDTCVFTGNRALWGAGVFSEIDDKSGGNFIKIINSHFLENVASFAGGAIRVGINSDGKMGHNSVEVQESVFIGNKAMLGGAFSQYQPMRKRDRSMLMHHCQFIDNVAAVASTMHFQHLNAKLINVTIQYSEAQSYLSKPKQGSLYCYSSTILMDGYNIMKGAKSTGFILDFCTLVLNGTTNFTGNSGINGGALAMFGHAKIRFATGSKLILHYNKALAKGGAVFVETPVPLNEKFNTTQLNIYRCFFIFGDNDNEFKDPDTFNTTIDFLGNIAPPSGGSNVWATTLTWCRGKDENEYNNTALKWKIINYNGTLPAANTTVVTSPKFIFSNKEQWNAHPGVPIHPRVILRDENWNIVNGTVRIQINSICGSVFPSGSEVDLIANRKESLHLKGAPGSVYDIILQTSERSSVSMPIKNRTLKNCSPGFYLRKQTCGCQPISKGVTHCDVEKNSVYIIPSRWGNTKCNDEFAKLTCPMHYCKRCKDTGIGCLFKQNDQCAQGRDSNSPLCSRCQQHFSVHLGAETCEECKSNKGLLWIIPFAVILTVLTFLIMAVNLDTYSTYLNGFLYSYQIIPLLLTDEKYIDYFISLVMSLTNVSGTGKYQKGFCIWVGMNDMQKLLLNYLAPVYLIFCTCIIGALSSICRKCPFNKRTTFRAFVFISVISYADFTKLSFKILRPVKIGGHYYAYFAAYMPYFGAEHLPFAILALAFGIFIVIGFPLALLFSNHIIRFRGLVKLMGIFDTFQQPFRREPYITNFAVFYFLNRLVLLTLHISMQSGPIRDVTFGITCIVILVIFLVCKPYVDWEMNFFDGLQLTNIAIMAMIFTGISVAYETDVRILLMTVNWVLAYIPLLCLLFRILVSGAKKLHQYHERRVQKQYSEIPDIPYSVYEDEEND